jgi:hypothetical protein
MRLPALHVGRCLLPGKFLVLIALEAESTLGHSATERIRPIEKSSILIRKQTYKLPACSIVPQQTMLPRDPITYTYLYLILKS